MIIHVDRSNIECYTPKYAVDMIIPYLDKSKIIWAPFSKNEHHYADYLRERGFKVINTHISTGQDFLTYEPDFEFDMIIDNPPFKGKTEFMKRTISFNKPFALFLPINGLGDGGLPKLFMENNIALELLIPDKRTEFENQPQKGISFKTVYMCNGILPKQIIFTKINTKFK